MISTHVLDLTTGTPAEGVRVTLARALEGARIELGAGVTDRDGRVKELVSQSSGAATGILELTFETGAYWASRSIKAFHPRVTVTIEVTDATQHYHVPLLLSPFGYSTYRGS